MLTQIKRNAFAASIILLFLAGGILYNQKDSFLFHQLSERLWKAQLLQDTLSMHYTVAHPENFQISSYQSMLPTYSPETSAENGKLLEFYTKWLGFIDPDSLPAQESLDCRLLTSYLQLQQEENRFSYYEEPLSPASGSQSQLPILLAEYTFRSKKDVTDYLALLDQVDNYFAGLTVYEKEKAAAGLFMSDSSADQVMEQCNTIIDKISLNNQSHFLVQTFQERLNTLAEKNLITAEEQALYLSENDRLLTTVVQPAYEKLADEIFLLKGSGTNSEGLCHYPKGREYYTHLVHSQTCTAYSIDELKTMLTERLSSDYLELARLSAENASLTSSGGVLAIPDFSLNTPEAMISHLKQEMQQDFPALPDSDPAPSYVVKEVSESLEPYASPAFYLTPPLDDISNNTIYINQSSTPSGLSLYTTLAHEGYPGHLYQSVYYQLSANKDIRCPVRNLLYYGGYTEGWAFYVETLSYQYAARLLEGTPDSQTLAFCCNLERIDRDMQLCLYSILDIAIHHDGASYEQVHNTLSKFGLTDPSVTRQLYEYIVSAPANYLKYYIGYLEILNLKQNAQEIWGSSYTDKAFHTFLLQSGPCDFDTLHTLLKEATP